MDEKRVFEVYPLYQDGSRMVDSTGAAFVEKRALNIEQARLMLELAELTHNEPHSVDAYFYEEGEYKCLRIPTDGLEGGGDIALHLEHLLSTPPTVCTEKVATITVRFYESGIPRVEVYHIPHTNLPTLKRGFLKRFDTIDTTNVLMAEKRLVKLLTYKAKTIKEWVQRIQVETRWEIKIELDKETDIK